MNANAEQDEIDRYLESLGKPQKEAWSRFEAKFPKPNSSFDSENARHYQSLKEIYCIAAETADPKVVKQGTIFEIINDRLKNHGEGKDFVLRTDWRPEETFKDISTSLEFDSGQGKWFTIFKILTTMQDENSLASSRYIKDIAQM